jgi:hypothetical protein
MLAPFYELTKRTDKETAYHELSDYTNADVRHSSKEMRETASDRLICRPGHRHVTSGFTGDASTHAGADPACKL